MKKKTIDFDGTEVELGTSAALPVLYRLEFNADLFKDMATILNGAKDNGIVPYESVLTIYQLVYAMAKHANGSIKPYIEWLSQFNIDTFLDHMNEIIELYLDDQKETSTLKKDSGQ